MRGHCHCRLGNAHAARQTTPHSSTLTVPAFSLALYIGCHRYLRVI
jgi:hypothetical protein